MNATSTIPPGGRRPFAGFLRSRGEYRLAFVLIVLLMAATLVYPVATVLVQSFWKDGAVTLSNWTALLMRPAFREMLANSFIVAGLAAFFSAVIAFFVAYGLTFTNVPKPVKRVMHLVMLLPLFLPSITYGFAVIYSFGRMGLVSQLIGKLPFSIYGFWGLLITDIVYTLPPAFLVLYNAFRYVDRRFVTLTN